MGYVGRCSVLPLNAMVDAAPWVHGFVNRQQYRASYLCFTYTHQNLCMLQLVWVILPFHLFGSLSIEWFNF